LLIDEEWSMDTTIYDKAGNAVAYLTEDFHSTIYLWDGTPVAYLYEEQQIYGINGHHLGWYVDNIVFNNKGERIGFTFDSCPVSVAKQTPKDKQKAKDEIRVRWEPLPKPKLGFNFAEQDLADFFREGEIIHYRENTNTED
jgi:hypothetical protein